MNKNIAAIMFQSRRFGPIVALATLSLVFTAGCTRTHTYQWTEYRIQPARIATSNEFTKEGAVSIINAQSNDAPMILGTIGSHKFYGSLNQLTGAIITQLTSELTKRKITVRSDAPKSIQIKVVSTDFEQGTWQVRAKMTVHLQAGNNYVKDILVNNSTPTTVAQAFDGAVAIAVIEILNNTAILAYLQE
jgi:hypothetical protein